MKLRPLDKIFIATFIILIVIGLFITKDHYDRMVEIKELTKELTIALESLPIEQPSNLEDDITAKADNLEEP